MNENIDNFEEEIKTNPLKVVTPFSKYLSLLLFIALPFIGGWIGYKSAPIKFVVIERIIYTEVNTNPNSFNDLLEDEEITNEVYEQIVPETDVAPRYAFNDIRMKPYSFGDTSDIFIAVSMDGESLPLSGLAGWSVRSLKTGISLELHDWSGSDLEIAKGKWEVVIDPMGDPENNHAMEGQVNMYYGMDEVFWDTESDIIQLINAEGGVVDEFVFKSF